ncbi:hypothetical protein Scep_004432 [Stephania cephalantha]|uniref:Uncharacterized protein n=1 Tax=Stephania cephalantha TaxID=152367 RepID=A0AAP0KSG5_9MAGN
MSPASSSSLSHYPCAIIFTDHSLTLSLSCYCWIEEGSRDSGVVEGRFKVHLHRYQCEIKGRL